MQLPFNEKLMAVERVGGEWICRTSAGPDGEDARRAAELEI
jgi:hypothetical protein